MSTRIIVLLTLAALLEVGGDALIRGGLQRKGFVLLLAGSATLVVYGFMVNMTKLDFSRLMGIYIVVFFVVSQLVARFAFHEHADRGMLAGGGLIVLGGIVMTLLRS
jgi:small multidrug resistance family-3 protein